MAANPAPAPLNAGEPIAPPAPRDTVTLVDGTTFCISAASGDIESDAGAQGLFFHDTRIVSRWQLRIDGIRPQTLSVLHDDNHLARFLLRRPPAPGTADSTMLVLRQRTVGAGMRETITLRNVGRETSVVRVQLLVGTDFADLFAVKEGHARGHNLQAIAGMDLVFTRGDGTRGLLVHATGDPVTQHDGLSWQAVVDPRTEWTVEVTAQPLVDQQRVPARSGLPREACSEPIAWRDTVTSIQAEQPDLDHMLRRTVVDLDGLRITDDEGRGRFVAAGAPWFMTLFGRDSLLTAWMCLPLDPSLAVGTLQTLAELQGRKAHPPTEEEPGRILHELRLGPENVHALGGEHYYGTVDASPLFVALLAQARRWGASEVDVSALLPAADAALSWMEQYGDRDGDGFLEYQRATDRGLINQGWKDSWDGINDAAGHMAEAPVALAEVQGYAYAAWLARAELAEAFGDPQRAEACRQHASKLRQRFAEEFWLPQEGYFAVALDGNKRPLDALTSNPGHCLWTGIVDDEHAATMIARMSRSDLDSGFGLRTLSTEMGAYNPMSYHNGSVWPHDTALAVAGLMRYGHIPGAVTLAHRLADGLLRAATAFGGRLPELYCGFPSTTFGAPVPYPTSCSPQAWASAAPLLLIRSFLGLEVSAAQRQISLHPRLPARWGTVTIDRLRLPESSPGAGDGAPVRITANGGDAQVESLPDGWTVTRSV
jgi:glycogen debranching enzyme